MPYHEVKQGDCMASIADEYGFFWKTIWHLAENSELRRKRTDPYVLLSVKHESSVGGRIDVRRGSPAGNVYGADQQRLVTIGVRDLDPDFRPAGAGMHDEAQGLVPEALETPWRVRLWGCRPRSDPP